MKLQATTMAALVFLSGAASSAAASQSIDLALSNDTALLRYTMPVSYSSAGRTDADFGLLYTEANDMMMMAGIAMSGEAGSQAPGLYGGVGFRAYGVSLDSGNDVGSVTLGGLLRYVPPTLNRVGLVGQLNYGPDITTFGDAQRFWDFNARVEYEVLPAATVYLGYRNVETRLELNDLDVTLDKGAHVGLKMSF
jgi:hypothetical protein